MQQCMNLFAEACRKFGLSFSTEETVVMSQHVPKTINLQPCICIDGQQLKVSKTFTYLGSTLSQSGTIDDEVTLRISKAIQVFLGLEECARDSEADVATNLKAYNEKVIPVLLYAVETWPAEAPHDEQLNFFQRHRLRSMQALDEKPETLHSMRIEAQLCWAGKVVRMPENCLAKQLLYCEVSKGKRPRGRPRTWYKDTLKESPKSTGIAHESWEKEA